MADRHDLSDHASGRASARRRPGIAVPDGQSRTLHADLGAVGTGSIPRGRSQRCRGSGVAAGSRANSAIASLSCGVDSCFTLFRHARRLAGRRSQRIAATVVQHGFDVWLHNKGSDEVFERLLADARELSGSLGLPCIPMKTNFQQMRLNWSHAWGTQIACGLHLLAGRYDTALTANDMPYQWMGMAWPRYPVTNPLLGSKGFALIDDGGEFSRSEKAKVIADWPEAIVTCMSASVWTSLGPIKTVAHARSASERSWRFALPGAQGQQHSYTTQVMPRSGASGCIWSPGSGAGSNSLGAPRRQASVKQVGPRP